MLLTYFPLRSTANKLWCCMTQICSLVVKNLYASPSLARGSQPLYMISFYPSLYSLLTSSQNDFSQPQVALFPWANLSAHPDRWFAGVGRSLGSTLSRTEALVALLDRRLSRVIGLKLNTMKCLRVPLLFLKLKLTPQNLHCRFSCFPCVCSEMALLTCWTICFQGTSASLLSLHMLCDFLNTNSLLFKHPWLLLHLHGSKDTDSFLGIPSDL